MLVLTMLGKQSKAEEEKIVEEETVVMFSKEGDTNGVIYGLGGSTKVTVYASSVAR